VDCSGVRVSELAHTARFVCTTDEDMCQIASFYAGAMSESRLIELLPIADRHGGLDLVMISPDDPDGMLRHARECRQRGYRFAVDPSQQLARMTGEQVRDFVTGASALFTNDYEWQLLLRKTGWTEADVLATVGMRITTLGEKGVEIISRDGEDLQVLAVPELTRADPTGIGDGFRAGYLAGAGRGLGQERCAQLGSLIAVLVLETIGTQEWVFDREVALRRLSDAYGPEAAAEIEAILPG
jgi:adenosine kinase